MQKVKIYIGKKINTSEYENKELLMSAFQNKLDSLKKLALILL